MSQTPGAIRKPGQLRKRIWRARYLYLLMIPGLAFYIIFRYIPLGGIILAFKNYKARLGIWGSAWVGLDHFRRMFITPRAIDAIFNTLRINLMTLLITMPAPLILALLINELRMPRIKKVYQTVFTFPHFLSWVIVSSLMINLFSAHGAVNSLLVQAGGERIQFLATTSLARPLLYFTSLWKSMGWNSIIYLAAISGIDPAMYEAATIDGANRMQRIRYITFPALKELLIVMVILAIGNLMDSGFEQIYNLRNAVTTNAMDTLDTYVYDITFGTKPDYSFSAAVSLFKSAVNVILLFSSDRLSKLALGQGVFK